MSQLTETVAPFAQAAPTVSRRAARPTALQWALHAALFLVTAITTTISGIVWTASPDVDAAAGSVPGTAEGAGSLLLIPWYYLS